MEKRMRSVTPHPRRSRGLVVLVPLLLAACSASGASPSVATPRPATQPPIASASPTPGATASPTPEPSVAAAESASPAASDGPVAYSAWVERQGFGGSSGLAEVAKETNWMRDHPTEVTAFDIQTTLRFVDHLATWLDENPATACWSDYHATVRATLGRMHDAYTKAHDARAAGNLVPADIVTSLVTDANAADAMPAPAGC
jgi:hypothetical protein